MASNDWTLALGLALTLTAGAGPAIAEEASQVAQGGQAINLDLTGTLDGTSFTCGLDTAFHIPAGTDLYLCYEVTNTGSVVLTRHDLADTYFGTLLVNFPYTLGVGASAFLTQNLPHPPFGNDSAIWTAYNPGPLDEVSDTDILVVTIAPPLIGCNLPTSTFSGGIPVGWTSHDPLAWPSSDNSATDWRPLAGCLEAANYTGARGNVACASSDLAPIHENFDTELRSHRFSLAGQSSARLEFTINYQNFAGADTLDVDVTTDDGGSWTNLLQLTTDQGLFRAAGGVDRSINLASVLGQSNIKLRWRYYDPGAAANDWYVQVDNIRLLCGNAVFLDGFSSGDSHAWSSALGAP